MGGWAGGVGRLQAYLHKSPIGDAPAGARYDLPMFRQLRQWFGRSLSFEQLSDRVDRWIQSVEAVRPPDSSDPVQMLITNPAWLESWRTGNAEILERIAGELSRDAQIIALRRETISQIEATAHAGAVLNVDHSDEDRQILRDQIFPHRSVDEVRDECYRGYAFAAAHIHALRAVSHELGDAREHDWVDYFSDLHEQLAEHSIGMMIAEAKDDIYTLESFVPELRRIADEAYESALAGENWHYDRDALRREQDEQEAEARDREPPRQPGLQKEQVLALSDLLTQRMKQIQEGGLYRVEDLDPPRPEQIFAVDTALMLIALDECLIDTDIAIQGMRHIISMTMDTFQPDSMPAEDVNMDVQLEFLGLWRENTEEPQLPRFCVAAAHLLYDIEPVDDDEEHSQAVAGIGAAILNDAWSMIAETKNVFGYAEPTSLFENG